MKKTRICDLLNIEFPVIQGAMAQIADARLAAAVSNAGCLGVISPGAGSDVAQDWRYIATKKATSA